MVLLTYLNIQQFLSKYFNILPELAKNFRYFLDFLKFQNLQEFNGLLLIQDHAVINICMGRENETENYNLWFIFLPGEGQG